ncbi:MAG: WGR domain-containing protein [Anaerolineales bacterium]|nr:WGR domain-containing protein [Anaerolineales bacterium]
MNRWYHVAVQPGLFDPYVVACAWGNRNTGYQRARQIPVATPEKGHFLAEKIIHRKLRRGYKLEETHIHVTNRLVETETLSSVEDF